MASTERPTAKATATSPADGAENNAAPQTALTNANVPMNSAAKTRCMMKSPVPAGHGRRRELLSRDGREQWAVAALTPAFCGG